LFFRVDNFEVDLPRARALISRLEEELQVNPNTGAMKFFAPRSWRILRHHQLARL